MGGGPGPPTPTPGPDDDAGPALRWWHRGWWDSARVGAAAGVVGAIAAIAAIVVSFILDGETTRAGPLNDGPTTTVSAPPERVVVSTGDYVGRPADEVRQALLDRGFRDVDVDQIEGPDRDPARCRVTGVDPAGDVPTVQPIVVRCVAR